MVRKWLATSVVVLVGVAGVAADASARGTIVIYSEWLADCDDCTPSGGVDLAVQTASGSFRNLYRLERRLGAGFVVGPVKPRLFVYPAIAQSGRWIAHVTRSDALVARRIDLARQRPKGSARQLVQFAKGDELRAIAWAPDGRSLALGGRIQGSEGVWIVGRDGTGFHPVLCGCDPRLGQPDTRITDVAWAPGRALAVMTESDTTGRATLYELTPDGLSLRKLSSHDPGDYEDPAWSPGGGSVALERHRSLSRSDIVVIDARTLISRPALDRAWGPAWSPDGSRMAFIEEGGAGTWQVGTDRVRHFPQRGALADLDAAQLAWLSGRPPRVRAAGAAARPRVYGGSLGPRPDGPVSPDPFYLTTSAAGAITGMGASLTALCLPDAYPVTVATRQVAPAAPAGPGRVAATLRERGRDGEAIELAIDAAVSPRQTTGTLRGRVTTADGSRTCEIPPRPFNARRDPGRIYAGAVSDVGIAVLRRSRGEVRVDVGYLTGCSSGSPWLRAAARIFASVGHGRFRERAAAEVPALELAYRFDVAGRLRPRRASGTFALRLRPSSEGGAGARCRLRATRWSAISG